MSKVGYNTQLVYAKSMVYIYYTRLRVAIDRGHDDLPERVTFHVVRALLEGVAEVLGGRRLRAVLDDDGIARRLGGGGHGGALESSNIATGETCSRTRRATRGFFYWYHHGIGHAGGSAHRAFASTQSTYALS